MPCVALRRRVRRVYAVRSLAIYTLKPYHPPLQRPKETKRETKMLCCFPRQASLICNTPRVHQSHSVRRVDTGILSLASTHYFNSTKHTPRYGEHRGTESTGVWRGGCLASGGLRQRGYTGSTTQATAYRRGGARGGLYDAGAYGTQYEGYGGEPAYDSEPYDEHFDG